MHVIIQAGGKGTRLEALTRNRPKCLVPVKNKPLIFWTFQAFKNSDFTVICDYKIDVVNKYIFTFGTEYNIKVIPANGEGTVSGISDAVSSFDDDAPICIVWCDLLFGIDFSLPEYITTETLEDNYIGLSGSFPCRWSFVDSKFVPSASSSMGVAGFFIFKNKTELDNIPKNGAFVPWLRDSNIHFKSFYLQNVVEVGTVKIFDELTKPSVCRPFNEVIINEETVEKKGIDEQGRRIACDEIAWYKHVIELNYEHIPRIYSYSPLIMERIKGKNICEYNYLTISEKKRILRSIVGNLKDLHNLDITLPAVKADLDETYIDKTFSRLDKVENLIPFARDEFIKINGRWYKNIFYDKSALRSALESYYPDRFKLIHGDCTFSNMIYDRLHSNVYLIDPRGYFGQTKLYGDPDYDWAKIYYSLVGNYDQFNRKRFSLAISRKDVELSIQSNGWSDMEDYFFELLDGVKLTKIRALHAVIWLSLTTYAWEDYDSICAAFYNGIIKSADFL